MASSGKMPIVDTSNAMKTGNIAVDAARQVDAYAGSAFDNPNAQMALAQMDPELREQYRKKGEAFYEMFDPNTSFGNMLRDIALKLQSSIRSGMSVDDLDEREIETLNYVYGKHWKAKIEGTYKGDTAPKIGGVRRKARRRKPKTKTYELTHAQRVKEESLALKWQSDIDGIFIEERKVE